MPGKAMWAVLVVGILGCGERERLVFESDPEDRLGPTSRIDPPSRDTTLSDGDLFEIGVLTVDPSGIDSVVIAVEGGNLSYAPVDADGADTLRFSLNLPTIGRGGQTITLGVFGVDVLGNVGPVVTRRLTIE
jgi:hypothetical protein